MKAIFFILIFLVHHILLFGVVYARDSGEQDNMEEYEKYIKKTYEECLLDNTLDYNIFKLGMIGYHNIKYCGLLSDKKILVIIDYTISSNNKRFFVIDLVSNKVLYHTLVAHGKNTGNEYARYFSNKPRTQKSSIGFYLTGETYKGKHGYSLKLDGLDSLYNDNARTRKVIIHGAHYVSDAWAKKYGRIGRSWGCPALPEDVAKEIIDVIKEGCCLFAFYDDKEYLMSSKHLKIHDDVLKTIIGVD